MTQLATGHDTLVSEFETFRQDPAFGSDRVGRARERAFERFLDRGFPSTREEEWRFTNVSAAAAERFVRAGAVSLDRADLSPWLVPGSLADIVVINGRVSRTWSSLGALGAGVTIRTLADTDGTAGHVGGLARGDHGHVSVDAPVSPFVDLNGAFFEDVVTLEVAPRTVLDRPIQVLSVSVGGVQPVLVAPRLFIHVGTAAEVSIVETYAGLGAGAVLTAAVTEVHLEPGAIVDHVRVQQETNRAFHFGSLSAWLGRSSTFSSLALTCGGRIARNDIGAVLDGEGAECTLNGLYVATGDSLVDTHTTIDHARPHCPSHEVYKGILGGRAKAVFNGKILVRPDAQKTDAKQTNRALLLSDDAQVNTKPQLEIFADDVKCTHGAAIGQLDEDALFYLQARGIDQAAARIMLIHAFADEVLDGIRWPAARDLARRLVDRKLSID